jgi:processive 1,2-diacylglycerol beta-glucosyltransferase
MNILILTVSAGSGHINAAEAIKDRFESKYPDSNILLVDTYKYVNPWWIKLL